MSQEERKALWDELVNAGVKPTRHYRTYSVAELQEAVDRLHEYQAEQLKRAEPAFEFPTPEAGSIPHAEPSKPAGESLNRAPDTVAGIRQNQSELEALRVDENGVIWYQDEVRKPGYAAPRGRRILRYVDSGSKRVELKDGNGAVVESFEMPGDEHREMEAKITLPSFQTGIYKSPRYPFKVHVYDSREGFDYFEVCKFYGGPDRVPAAIKKVYVSTVLCFDIMTTVREMEAELRERTLGKEARR
jgi:hypothetical protein